MENNDVLITIAVCSLAFFKLWDKSYNVRQKIYYKIKKLIRPIFIYIGGLNERERIKREARASQFKDSGDSEGDRLAGSERTDSREAEGSGERAGEPDRGSSGNLEIIRREAR